MRQSRFKKKKKNSCTIKVQQPWIPCKKARKSANISLISWKCTLQTCTFWSFFKVNVTNRWNLWLRNHNMTQWMLKCVVWQFPIDLLWRNKLNRSGLLWLYFSRSDTKSATSFKYVYLWNWLFLFPISLAIVKLDTSQKETWIQKVQNSNVDSSFTAEDYKCGQKGEPLHHTSTYQPTWILHQQDQAHTQGLVWSIPIHFLSSSWLAGFRLHSSAGM